LILPSTTISAGNSKGVVAADSRLAQETQPVAIAKLKSQGVLDTESCGEAAEERMKNDLGFARQLRR
jgi:hypothetical protein